jgi:hypothetical protein
MCLTCRQRSNFSIYCTLGSLLSSPLPSTVAFMATKHSHQLFFQRSPMLSITSTRSSSSSSGDSSSSCEDHLWRFRTSLTGCSRNSQRRLWSLLILLGKETGEGDGGIGEDILEITPVEFGEKIDGILRNACPKAHSYYSRCFLRGHSNFIWTGPEPQILP